MKVRHVHDRKAKHPNSSNSPRRFTVDLTEGEVDFLLGVTEGIGGDLQNSPRKYAARIHEALSEVTGYAPRDTDAYQLARGAMWFTEYDTKPQIWQQSAYNHLRDGVTVYSLLGQGVTKIPPYQLDLLAETADDLAIELADAGYKIDDIPVPFRNNHRRAVRVRV